MTKIKIAITDDDSLIAQLLENYLNKYDSYKVLFTANNGLDLIDKLKDSDELPDILLLDLKMQGMDGIETTQYIKSNHPEIKTIVISSHYQSSFLGFLFKTGASAFVPKGISPDLLKEIIDRVYTSGIYFMEDQVNSMRGQISSKAPKPELHENLDLTEREIDVLKLICMQKTAKEIGEMLFITTRTVEGHKNNLFLKTGAKNIAGLVVYAIQNNVVNITNLPL
mgnify:CR=1 FL=1